MALLTRLQMVDKIENGEPVIFNGRIYYTVDSLPTQDEIDAVYAGATIAADLSVVTAAIGDVLDTLPPALDADGGFKVHVQNPSSSSSGLTDTQLRATPVPVSDGAGSLTVDGTVAVSNFPAAQPVTDNGGSLTVDGTVGVNNFPATQAVSAASLPLPTGASTSANQTTGNTSLASIDSKLPTALSGGALKVDVVGNTAGVGGLSMPAIATLFASAARNTNTDSADITNNGYKGIRLYFYITTLNSTNLYVRVDGKDANGHYTVGMYQTGNYSSNNTLNSITIYPGIVGTDVTTGNAKISGFLPKTFRVSVNGPSTGISNTWEMYYELLP